MKLHNHLKWALAALALAGCTDDTYDLENIDTTMKLTVKDLAIPVEMSAIQFGNLLELDSVGILEADSLKGYSIKTGGEFSGLVTIPPIHATPKVDIDIKDQEVLFIEGLEVDLQPTQFPFHYENDSTRLSSFITDIREGSVDFHMEIHFALRDPQGNRVAYELSNVAFDFPKGFYGNYEKGNGEVGYITKENSHCVFPRMVSDENGECVFPFNVTSLSIEDMESVNNAHINYETGEVEFHGSFDFVGGKIKLAGDLSALQIEQGILDLQVVLGELTINNFDGTVAYDIPDMQEQRVEFGELPEILTDPTTNIGLTNPEVYIQFVNPLSDCHAEAYSGLNITQIRPAGQEVISVSLANDIRITGKSGPQNFLIAANPDVVEPLSEYAEGIQKFAMEGLGDIISGQGLPQGLVINFGNPRVAGPVDNFPLGTEMDIQGAYTFYSPLSFTPSSQIIFEETQGGWGMASEEGFDVNNLAITGKLKSNLPVDITLEAYPIDAQGNQLTNEDGSLVDVEVSPATFPANAQDQEVSISMNCSLLEIDGIHFVVKINGTDDPSALSPSNKVELTDIQAKISGYYIISDTDE